MNDTELIECLLCGVKRYALGKHISSVHHITTKLYKEQFPQAKTQTDTVAKKFSDVQKGEKNGMFGIHRFGEKNPFYGKQHTLETRKKLSNSLLKSEKLPRGKKHWIYGKGEKSSFYGKDPRIYFKNGKSWFYGHKHKQEVIDKLKKDPRCITKGFLGHHLSSYNKEKLSKLAGERIKKNLYTVHGKYKNIFFDSSYECIFLKICDYLNLNIVRAYHLRCKYKIEDGS